MELHLWSDGECNNGNVINISYKILVYYTNLQWKNYLEQIRHNFHVFLTFGFTDDTHLSLLLKQFL